MCASFRLMACAFLTGRGARIWSPEIRSGQSHRAGGASIAPTGGVLLAPPGSSSAVANLTMDDDTRELKMLLRDAAGNWYHAVKIAQFGTDSSAVSAVASTAVLAV